MKKLDKKPLNALSVCESKWVAGMDDAQNVQLDIKYSK
jgi:hypothetical protein